MTFIDLARVLVEAGTWVRQGQVLATVDRSVQSQNVAQLAAQVQVARADAALAQNEYERSQALVGRGFVSKADLDRKKAARDAAYSTAAGLGSRIHDDPSDRALRRTTRTPRQARAPGRASSS